MFTKVRWWAVVLGSTAILAAVTVGAVAFAQTPPPDTPGTESATEKTAYGQVFLGKLAALLGVEQQRLVEASKQAGKETVDEAVKNGDLSQAQADNLKSRIDQGPSGFGFPGHFGFDRAGRHGKPFGGPGVLGGQAVMQAAADKLGMTVQELHSELRSGVTLSTIAAEKGVAIEDVRSAMAAAAKAQLDQAVADGKLTRQQADAIQQRIEEGGWPDFHGVRGRR